MLRCAFRLNVGRPLFIGRVIIISPLDTSHRWRPKVLSIQKYTLGLCWLCVLNAGPLHYGAISPICMIKVGSVSVLSALS